jgi:hypothetical protein
VQLGGFWGGLGWGLGRVLQQVDLLLDEVLGELHHWMRTWDVPAALASMAIQFLEFIVETTETRELVVRTYSPQTLYLLQYLI